MQFKGHEMLGKDIKDVLKKYSDLLMDIPGVVAVGQGEWRGNQCIRVLVSDLNNDNLEQIPDIIDGYKVIVEESGEFRALDS
ncbi:hypothetical protein ACFLXY_00300 [Chloroflexota bacterium]